MCRKKKRAEAAKHGTGNLCLPRILLLSLPCGAESNPTLVSAPGSARGGLRTFAPHFCANYAIVPPASELCQSRRRSPMEKRCASSVGLFALTPNTSLLLQCQILKRVAPFLLHSRPAYSHTQQDSGDFFYIPNATRYY